MLKKILSLILLTIFLVGCSEEPKETDQTSNDKVVYEIPPSYQIALDAAEEKANYYQQLVKDLQLQLVNVKTELSNSRAEYEARIDALQAALDAYKPIPEESYSYTVYEDHATILTYLEKDKEVVIPAFLEECTVTKIADRAFENNTNVTKIIIPEGVTDIGWFAFSGCINLKEITIPANVRSIQYGAFENHSDDLVILCSKGSYAQEYAQSYGISFRNVE